MLDALRACVTERFQVYLKHSTFQLEPPRTQATGPTSAPDLVRI